MFKYHNFNLSRSYNKYIIYAATEAMLLKDNMNLNRQNIIRDKLNKKCAAGLVSTLQGVTIFEFTCSNEDFILTVDTGNDQIMLYWVGKKISAKYLIYKKPFSIEEPGADLDMIIDKMIDEAKKEAYLIKNRFTNIMIDT